MKRGFKSAAAGAALVVALFAVPGSAATPSQTSIQGAEATWYFDDAGVATAVLVRPVEESDHASGSTTGGVTGVDVQVTREFIDAATGQDVFHLYVSDPYYAPATTISVNGLKSASVQAKVDLYDVTDSTGPYTVDVMATWKADGAGTHTLTSVWDTEFGSWTSNKTNEGSVPALASGTLSGAFDYGALGEVQGVLRTAHTFNMFRPPAIRQALTGMLSVAGAESRSTYHITGATSTWVADDPTNAEVVLSVEQNHGASNASTATTWLEVYGGYCDTATGDSVSYDVSSEPVLVSSGSVDPSLQRAAASASFTLTGYEYRTPGGCAGPIGDAVITAIGPFQATASADWTAYGALSHYRKLFIERSPDLRTKDRYDSRARSATAAGMITGPLITATLTNVQNAFLYDQTNTSTAK